MLLSGHSAVQYKFLYRALIFDNVWANTEHVKKKFLQ